MKKNCSIRARLPLILFVLMLFPMFSQAVFGGPIKQVTINYIEASAAPDKFANRINVFVSVTGSDEQSIAGLSGSDFEAVEDGKKIEIDEVSQAADPMAIVLAIDTSGSMQARDKSGMTSMDAAKNAAIDFISRLSPNDQVALFSFNNEPFQHTDFTNDHNMVIDSIQALAAKNNAATCLFDTVYQAVKKSAEIPRGRRAIILLTDGKDEKGGRQCSTYNSSDVIDAATTKTIRVPIYTIGAGPKVDARELGRISSLTGGRSLLAASISELEEFYRTLANQLKNQYQVTYKTRIPSGEHSFVIKVQYEDSRGQDEKRFWVPPLPISPAPVIRFVSPDPTSKIKGTVSVKAEISPEETLAKVRYYVDASLKKEFTQKPFTVFKWNTSGLSAGLHIIRTEAIDIHGQAGTAELTVKISGPVVDRKSQASQTAKTVKKADHNIIWIIMLLILMLLCIVVIILLVRRRKPSEAGKIEQAESCGLHEKEADRGYDNDETMILTDTDMDSLAPEAELMVKKSTDLETETTFKITGIVKMGRSSGNEIHIPDKSVSRRHAEIFFDNGIYNIRDLGSANGTKVDGHRVLSGGTPLHSGAQIQLGHNTILEFQVENVDEDVDEDDATKIYEM